MSSSPPPLPMDCAGGCHCGAIRFEVTLRRLEALECNCSICTKKGFLHLIGPRSDFRLLRGREALTTYTFGTHTAQHHFCSHCGVHAFYIPRSHPDSVDVNLRCLDVDLFDTVTIRAFDGRNWEEKIGEIVK